MKYNPVTPKIISELENIVGLKNVITRPEELYVYSRDSTIFEHSPDVVVIPKTAEQVSEILKLANREKIPVVPRGAGTSASGSPIPIMGGIVLDMSRNDKILEIDSHNLTVEVESGVVCDLLNEELAKHGFFFPPDPASSPACTIAGMVANNSAGNMAMKYGTTRDHVLWLEVVLPTGEIIQTGSTTIKSVSQFDLTRLMVGSEGQLGVITKVGLKLTPLPEHHATAFFIFKSVEDAAKAAVRVRSTMTTIPCMLEFLNETTTRAAFDYAGLEYPVGYTIILDFDGAKDTAEADLEAGFKLCEKENPIYKEKAKDAAHRTQLLTARKAALPALARLRPTTCMEDCTVQITKLPQAAKAIEEIPERLGAEDFMDLGNFGHIGDGNMHPTFCFDERVEEQREAFFKGMDILYEDIILPLGGSVTGEHGIGLIRAKYISEEHGDASVKIMRGIKKLFDPNMILNPGKGKGG